MKKDQVGGGTWPFFMRGERKRNCTLWHDDIMTFSREW